MTLCEATMDIAEIEAKKMLNLQIVELISKLSDQMIDTAEEYEPEATD